MLVLLIDVWVCLGLVLFSVQEATKRRELNSTTGAPGDGVHDCCASGASRDAQCADESGRGGVLLGGEQDESEIRLDGVGGQSAISHGKLLQQ